MVASITEALPAGLEWGQGPRGGNCKNADSSRAWPGGGMHMGPQRS